MPLRDFIDKGIIKGEPLYLGKGGCLYRQGEDAAYFYLITEGSVGLIESTTGMNEQVIAPPDILLGITDLLNTTYTFTAFTLEPTRFLRLSKIDIEQALHNNPVLRLYLLKMMSYEASLTTTAFE